MRTSKRLLLYNPSKNMYIKGVFYQSETADSREATNFRFLPFVRWFSRDAARRNFSQDYELKDFLNLSGAVGLPF